MKALIICERGLEECEALIVYDLLTRAGIETVLAGNTPEVTSSHNVTIKMTEPLGLINPSDFHCLILPGGMPGTKNLQSDKTVDDIIDHFIANQKLICAICAAPSILINKGIIKNGEFTCYPGFECGKESTGEKVHVHENIITANGLGSAIEFGIEIIKKMLGESNAIAIKNKIQY